MEAEDIEMHYSKAKPLPVTPFLGHQLQILPAADAALEGSHSSSV